MTRTWIAIATLGLLLPGTVHARLCKIGGEEVNPDNGSTTAGKTGILTCWDDEGRKMYEHELRDGAHLGLDRSWGFDGGMRERQVNANGNSEGLAREFWPGGQLKSEATYRDGDVIGTARTWHKNGQLATLRVVPEAGGRAAVALEYDDQGRLRDFTCAAKSLLREDVRPCGFEHTNETELVDQRGNVVEKRRMHGGKVLLVQGFDASGKLRETHETTPKGRLSRTYYESGQAATEAVVENDYVVSEAEWYMNGSYKSKTMTEPVERDARRVVEQYRDTGVLQSREERRGRRRVHGELFDESGKRSEEFVYDDEDRVKLHRRFAPDGTLTLEEELYPDGSRKVTQQIAQ